MTKPITKEEREGAIECIKKSMWASAGSYVTAYEARVVELEAALKPFAEAEKIRSATYDIGDRKQHDLTMISHPLKDFRRARKALGETE